MKFFTIIPLVIAVIFQMASHAVELDPLLADAQDIGIDLANHIKVTENVAVEDVVAPTAAPTLEPTFSPTTEPSLAPTPTPSAAPTTAGETNAPSYPATTAPSFTPTASPSAVPTLSPTVTAVPSASAPIAPTVRPTRNPSLSPTAAPTVPGQTNAPSTFAPSTSAPSFGTTPILTFSSSVGVGGLDSPDLDSASQLSIAQATCTSMNLPTSSCSFTSSYESTNAPAGSPTSRRLRTQSEKDASVAIKLQSITVICVVDTVTSVPAGTDPTTYFSTLSTTLTNAVTSSAFTTNLQTASSTNGATQTASATVTGVTASDPVVTTYTVNPTASPTLSPTYNPPSDDDDKLSDGAIAGIVIGVVVGVALIAAAVYYFFLRPSRSGYESDSTNFNAKSYGRGGADAPINL